MDLDVLHKYLPWRNCGTWMCCINIYHGGIVDLDVLHKYLPWRNCGPGCGA